MSEIKWKEKGGKETPLPDMSSHHLKTAFLSLATREYKVFQEINMLHSKLDTFQDLKNAIKAELKNRGEEPVYPDQKDHMQEHYGRYFESERNLPNVESVKAVISTEVNG